MNNPDTQVFYVSASEEGKRLDIWLADKLGSVTRSYVQKLVLNGFVKVNGVNTKSGLKLKAGMKAEVNMPEPVSLELEAQNIPLDIIYEDRDIIVINKPKDMVVHPAAGNWDGTLVNALLNHCGDSLSDINGVIRPGIVHRIDKDTTGLLVVAKNNKSHLFLSQQLKSNKIKRTYEAIVDGNIKAESGTINAPVGRHPVNRKKMAVNRKNGKPAITHYRVIEQLKGHTYVQLELETGRTHQIRVHMASIGHPVTGDPVYGKPYKKADTSGQVLHARFLKLIHPETHKEMIFEAPLPDYFINLLQSMRNN
jgi:23S rRNA pseudouridine1911/1915/1917 synthase